MSVCHWRHPHRRRNLRFVTLKNSRRLLVKEAIKTIKQDIIPEKMEDISSSLREEKWLPQDISLPHCHAKPCRLKDEPSLELFHPVLSLDQFLTLSFETLPQMCHHCRHKQGTTALSGVAMAQKPGNFIQTEHQTISKCLSLTQ